MRVYISLLAPRGEPRGLHPRGGVPEDACRQVIRGFSDDFAAKAELVAIEGEHIMRPARAYNNTDL